MVGARVADDGRIDSSDTHAIGADLREAYERGRRDERASRRRHPIFMTLTFAAAVVGVVLLALAAVNGSFTQAGSVVDQNLSIAAGQAQSKVADATR
ncbi:MAG: hypothetical protein ACJ798_13830 [Phenylobacterium sp.]